VDTVDLLRQKNDSISQRRVGEPAVARVNSPLNSLAFHVVFAQCHRRLPDEVDARSSGRQLKATIERWVWRKQGAMSGGIAFADTNLSHGLPRP